MLVSVLFQRRCMAESKMYKFKLDTEKQQESAHMSDSLLVAVCNAVTYFFSSVPSFVFASTSCPSLLSSGAEVLAGAS